MKTKKSDWPQFGLIMTDLGRALFFLFYALFFFHFESLTLNVLIFIMHGIGLASSIELRLVDNRTDWRA